MEEDNNMPDDDHLALRASLREISDRLGATMERVAQSPWGKDAILRYMVRCHILATIGQAHDPVRMAQMLSEIAYP